MLGVRVYSCLCVVCTHAVCMCWCLFMCVCARIRRHACAGMGRRTPSGDHDTHLRSESPGAGGLDSFAESTTSVNFEESADADEVMRMLEQVCVCARVLPSTHAPTSAPATALASHAAPASPPAMPPATSPPAPSRLSSHLPPPLLYPLTRSLSPPRDL